MVFSVSVQLCFFPALRGYYGGTRPSLTLLWKWGARECLNLRKKTESSGSVLQLTAALMLLSPQSFTTTLFFGPCVGHCPGLPTGPQCSLNEHYFPTDHWQAPPPPHQKRSPPLPSLWRPASVRVGAAWGQSTGRTLSYFQTSRGTKQAPPGLSAPPSWHT